MESFFESAFPDVNFDLTSDTHVCCPFPHKDSNGVEYYETRPSCSIKVSEGIYHCFSCGASGNEIKFISEYMGIDLYAASKLKSILDSAKETSFDWKHAEETLESNPQTIESIISDYKFNQSAIQQLHLGLEGPGRGIAFPVFLFNKLVDVISYNPGNTPKYKKRTNSPNGIIMPYDTWKDKKQKRTLIVAGQKDLGIALTHKFNAIAITGGEGTLPIYFVNDFKDREVSIIFDNDDTGRKGAIKLAIFLSPFVKSLNIIDLSNTCTEKGEDLWDYFIKYNKTRKDLVDLIRSTPEFTKQDYEEHTEKEYPTVSLSDALKPEYQNKTLRSNVQVIASNAENFLMDSAIQATKGEPTSNIEKNKMHKNETRMWEYSINKPEQLFYLIDSSLKEHQIDKHKRAIMRLTNEDNIKLQVMQRTPVYKASVSDYFEASNIEDKVTEYEVYSLNKQLESGKRYKITYRIVPHPLQGNTLYLVVFGVEDAQDSVSNFKITPDVINQLKQFQVSNSLEKTIDEHIERLKGIVNADLNSTLLQLIDLWYNTPLKFSVEKTNRTFRSYLDMLIVAESRIGKSSTAQALQLTYNLGTRVPLNGSNATIAGIVGGSQKTKNGFQTRAGAIPRAHKGAIIFEELMKAKQDIQRELTEIRSSNQAIITRVSGSITLPAFVRMLTLTNARSDDSGNPRSINSYPNGIEVVIDLVGTPEDIARYDVICVLPDRGAKHIDPFYEPLKPFPQEYYQNRIRWIWSRTEKQVSINEEIYRYAVQKANELNENYDSYIKLFGPEAWMKLIRLSIAIAGYVVSTDESFQNIIVQKEHIDYASKLLINLYDNDTFRLKEYVDQEREFSTVHDKDVETLQRLWRENAALLNYLQNNSRVTHRALQSVSGLDSHDFNRVLSVLVSNLFVTVSQNDITPMVKFRKAMKQIDTTITVQVVTI